MSKGLKEMLGEGNQLGVKSSSFYVHRSCDSVKGERSNYKCIKLYHIKVYISLPIFLLQGTKTRTRGSEEEGMDIFSISLFSLQSLFLSQLSSPTFVVISSFQFESFYYYYYTILLLLLSLSLYPFTLLSTLNPALNCNKYVQMCVGYRVYM